MSREVRRRVTLGVGLPVLAIVVVGAIVFALSRIFLAVPEAAEAVALLFAANVLIGSAVAAAVPSRRSYFFLATVLVATIAAGGVAGAVVGPRPIEPHVAAHPETPEAQAVPGPTPEAPPEATPPQEEPPEDAVVVVAQDIAFDTDTLELPAGEVTIHFENRDAAPHNVSIYTAPGGEVIFQDEPFPGPDTRDYTFQTPPPGEYYFQCDVHPTMNGSVVVG